jgi:integrase
MPRAATKAASLADGPTLASTRDYWILHLRSEGKSERTISTYLRALDRLDGFLVERHTWASSMLAAGHSEGDVMQLSGLTDRSMLSRYGASAAAERARAAYRSPIDRLARHR